MAFREGGELFKRPEKFVLTMKTNWEKFFSFKMCFQGKGHLREVRGQPHAKNMQRKLECVFDLVENIWFGYD